MRFQQDLGGAAIGSKVSARPSNASQGFSCNYNDIERSDWLLDPLAAGHKWRIGQ
jgi:hypothetical protein